MSTPEWVSVTSYAARFDVTRTTVYKWRDAGLLDVFRLARVLRIRNQPPKQSCASCQQGSSVPPASPPQ